MPNTRIKENLQAMKGIIIDMKTRKKISNDREPNEEKVVSNLIHLSNYIDQIYKLF